MPGYLRRLFHSDAGPLGAGTSDFLVTVMVGSWSCLVWAPGQTDAATAQSAVVTNIAKKIAGVVGGGVLQYQPPPNVISLGISSDYLVTLTASGSWTVQVYVEDQPSSITAGNAALANMQQKISASQKLTLGVSTLFSPTQARAQLLQAM